MYHTQDTLSLCFWFPCRSALFAEDLHQNNKITATFAGIILWVSSITMVFLMALAPVNLRVLYVISLIRVTIVMQ